MARVKFEKTEVKYKGVFYPANAPFEADEEDVEALVEAGAKVSRRAKAVEDEELEASVKSELDEEVESEQPEKEADADEEDEEDEERVTINRGRGRKRTQKEE